MTPAEMRELARRINHATPEELAQAMEKLPTDALEFAVRLEALGFEEREPA